VKLRFLFVISYVDRNHKDYTHTFITASLEWDVSKHGLGVAKAIQQNTISASSKISDVGKESPQTEYW